MTDTRNYNTISPSARTLLLMKGYTKIPYAREAAGLIQFPKPYAPDFSNPQPGFWLRVTHFEARYWSIDALLSDLLPVAGGANLNILELSSGFSFRGLALAAERPVYYIDSDLSELIEIKKRLVAALATDEPTEPAPPAATPTPGHYELRPLNALDESAFEAVIAAFPPGPLVIVNEGLLMYLGIEEKKKLGALILKALQQRGGYWITADIYLKGRIEDPELQRGDTMKQFLDAHHVYDNMFETFEEATALFTSMGFAVDKEAEPDYANISTLQYFLKTASPELLGRLRARGEKSKIHATWRLKPATPPGA